MSPIDKFVNPSFHQGFITTGKKKVPVVCLAGCAVVSVFGSGNYDRKKKVPAVCLAGCAVVSVFGSGDYDRKKKFQSTVSFFSPVVIMIAHPPDRRLYLFFPVVIKISRHNKKTANFPPEPKTDTTAQPARQTTVTFFFPVVITRTKN